MCVCASCLNVEETRLICPIYDQIAHTSFRFLVHDFNAFSSNSPKKGRWKKINLEKEIWQEGKINM